MHSQTIITLFTQHAFWLDKIDAQNSMNTRLAFFLLLESYDGEVHQMTIFSNGYKKAVTCNSMAKHFYEQHSQTIRVELWNMSGNVNKIPMQVFHLRSYKGCDENVTLLQACYDNPLFQQEEAKFSSDVEKKPRSKDYTPADEIPEIEFDEKNDATKRRKLCLIGFIVCCVAVIGFLVGYLVSSAKST